MIYVPVRISLHATPIYKPNLITKNFVEYGIIKQVRKKNMALAINTPVNIIYF